MVPYKESVLHSDVASGKLILIVLYLCCLVKCTSSRLLKNVALLCLGILLPKLFLNIRRGSGVLSSNVCDVGHR